MLTTKDQDKLILSQKRVKLNYDKNVWKEVYSPYYKTILLFLTGKCNLRCPKCFNCGNMFSKADMDFDFLKKLVQANPLVDKYDIMGGEPMLHPHIEDILRFLDSENKKIGLYTNDICCPN